MIEQAIQQAPHVFDRLSDLMMPELHACVALVGKIPAGTLTVAGLIALWWIRGKIAHFVFVAPGVAVGVALGYWLCAGLGWHPLLAIIGGMLINAAIFQLLGHFYFLRLGIAVLAWPILALIVCHLALGALDIWWAMAITAVGAWTLGSVLRRFANTENHQLYAWAYHLMEDLRGD